MQQQQQPEPADPPGRAFPPPPAPARAAARGAHHRRARSEVAFRLPDDLGLGGGGGPEGDGFDEIGSEDDLFSTFMDIEKISSSGPSDRDRDRAAETSSPPRPKHRHSSSVDGSGLFFSPGVGGGSGKDAAASLAEVMEAKKAMSPEQLAELAAIDPKHAKRCRLIDLPPPYLSLATSARLLGIVSQAWSQSPSDRRTPSIGW
jgi:hypothetical protein